MEKWTNNEEKQSIGRRGINREELAEERNRREDEKARGYVLNHNKTVLFRKRK